MQDYFWNHSDQQALTDAADTLSTNVTDVGSAKKVFAGAGVPATVEVTADDIGTTPTFRARFVGADDAALTTNPEVLCETGVLTTTAAMIPLTFSMQAANQRVAKRYYGWIFTQGNDDNDRTVNAFVGTRPQTNLTK